MFMLGLKYVFSLVSKNCIIQYDFVLFLLLNLCLVRFNKNHYQTIAQNLSKTFLHTTLQNSILHKFLNSALFLNVSLPVINQLLFGTISFI